MNIEHKLLDTEARGVEVSADEMTFTGYAAVFGNTDSYGDVIAPGAFTKTLAEAKSGGRWPVMLAQHGFADGGDTPIGVWADIEEDDYGLKVTGNLADTPRGKEMYALMKMRPRPAISGLSIGYVAKAAKYGDGKSSPERTLTEISLHEISIVSFPANTSAQITGVKSINPRELEDALREAGLSRGDAVKAVSVVKNRLRDEANSSDPRDEVGTAEDEVKLAELAGFIRNLTK